MTGLQNEDRFCRKSSVYNQTGQTYFQQLSAYNHMSAHLRRVLLAPCIVDSRNKRYLRNKGLGYGRFSSRSKSLDKIRMQEEIIDGIAYDTQHHPLDVLTKSLECSPECHREVKEVCDACGRCDDWTARSHVGVTSCTIEQRIPINSDRRATICQCLRLQPCKPCSNSALKRVSPKSSRFNENCRRVRTPIIVDRRERKKSASDRNETIKAPPSHTNVKKTEPSYAYDSSFESSSGNSTAPGSPLLKISEMTRGSQSENPVDVASRETNDNISENEERTDEAKYSKFIYDITQEITINGLYTDEDLHMIFMKHIDMNSDTLDRNKMQSEIHRLKIALNVRGSSDDDEFNDMEQLSSTGKFTKFSLEKKQTQSKIFDEYNVEEKMRQNEGSNWFGEPRRPKNSYEKSTPILVDSNSELLITEQDIVLTLREMKLDPRQIQSICKSLQKRSRETAPFQLVKNCAETSSFKRGQIQSNSPIDSTNGNRTIDVHRSYTDRKFQCASASSRKNQPCQCCCTNYPTAEELQSKVQPEIEIQHSPSYNQSNRINYAFTNNQMEGISETSITTRSAGTTESKKIHRASEKNEKQIIDQNISRESSLGSKKNSQENLKNLVKLVSNKSLENRNENHEEEMEKLAKIHMRRTRMMQNRNKNEDDSFIEIPENESDEDRDFSERTSNIKMRTSFSTVQNDDRIAHDSKFLADLKLESERNSKNDEIEKASKTRNSHDSSPPNEESDIMFVSHSRFLNNLRKNNVISLPDISENSEVITEEIATDENVKNIHETTSHLSHIEEVADNKMVNLTELTSQLDVVSVDNESSEMSENIDALKVPSLTNVSEGKIMEITMSETRKKSVSEDDDSTKKLSPSSILQLSGNSENDEDSDENKRVVVAALKPSSSFGLIPKITLSSSNSVIDKRQTIDPDEKTLSPDLSPRIPEKEDYKSSDSSESPKNSAKKKSRDESYSHKFEQRLSNSNSVNKSSDTSSIETELDQQETLHSTSEIQVEEEKSRVLSFATNSKAENEDEESRKLYELAEQSDHNLMKIHEISKSKSGINRPERDSSNSERKYQDKSENTNKQKEKQQIHSTRFSRLIRKENSQKNFGLEGKSEITEKELRISKKDELQQKSNFPDQVITTASDISFLRKQTLNDSAQLSIEIPLDPIDHQSEPTSSNSREIETNVAKNRSLRNSYTSMDSKKELTSENSKLGPEVIDRPQNINQSKNSISKRMKAAVGNLIKRSSKCTQMDETNKNLTRTISSVTTDSQANDRKSPNSEAAEMIDSSNLAIDSENFSCVCVLTTEKLKKNKTGNCRPDCRGRGFVCDQRCSFFHRILQ